MQISQVKFGVWSLVVALGAGVTSYLTISALNRDDFGRGPSHDQMFKTLNDVPDVEQRQDDQMSVALLERGLKSLDWTGKPPPIVVVGPPDQDPDRPPPKETVDSLIKIRGVRFDGDQPALSEVVFKYKSTAMVTAPQNSDGTFLKRVGDTLDGRLNQIKIEQIYPNGVMFSFLNEPKREHEFLVPEPYDLSKNFSFVPSGASPQQRATQSTQLIASVRDNKPVTQTLQLTPTKFRIGTDDARELNDRYPEILATEVSLERHRDPQTKRYDGVTIKGVTPGSIAARHGVQDGDVIKSINGHPVTSKDEAILFVKNNQDKYDVWEVEIWNKGQTRTITYYPPKK
jgi:type II secretory pathway component PulC